LIQLRNITKKYGDVIAVENINFEIEQGEIVGLLGPNGAGKTTIMNMIVGYIDQTKGDIIVNGYDTQKSPRKVKKEIGYMPESAPLYNDLTSMEFIKYMAELNEMPKAQIKDRVEYIIDKTGLESVKNKLIKNLSKGYKQRVSLAGALVANPKILILDEPTVGLDPRQIKEIRQLIIDIGKEHTVIISSHILSEISQMCNKIIIINEGKVVAINTPKELEDRTVKKKIIKICVEDNKNQIENVIRKIDGIEKIEFKSEDENGNKNYLIYCKDNSDIRKGLFGVLAKEGIVVLEIKKYENTLEQAFLNIVGNEKKKGDGKK
jgi:ABC-type multidrug transport system, ATPase component